MTDTVKRTAFADVMRGLAILGVVFYHLCAPSVFKTVLDHLVDTILITFFFYSGYFYTVGKRSLGENILNRFKTTMIPFVKHSTVFWIIGTIYHLISGEETLTQVRRSLRLLAKCKGGDEFRLRMWYNKFSRR